ncbi:MAG: pirin family protein [Alphaproteobacteria bacterium]|nr:pirin family protein [Alphaproteobacteria bacterium]
MLVIRKSAERGKTQAPRLVTHHSFAFGNYRDPSFVRFGALMALNENQIAAGGECSQRHDREAEVLSYVIEGRLAPGGDQGQERALIPGEIKRMRVGAGISHAEANGSALESCRALQIWIAPSGRPESPCEVASIDPEAARNRFARLAAPAPRAGEVRLTQDAELWAARLDADHEVVRPIQQGRRCWLQVAKGEVLLNERTLDQGDGAAVTDEDRFFLRAARPSELVLVDLA